MKIVHIQYPYVITDDGHQIAIDGIEGIPRVGSELVPADDVGWKVSAVTADIECVNGVCPIK